MSTAVFLFFSMIVIHRGKCWQSTGPCPRSSTIDRSVLLAGEKTHTGSPQRRWHWPNHTQPTAASGTHQTLGAKAEQTKDRQREALSVRESPGVFVDLFQTMNVAEFFHNKEVLFFSVIMSVYLFYYNVFL